MAALGAVLAAEESTETPLNPQDFEDCMKIGASIS